MDRSDFLLEIGSEEIPAGYLDPARRRLEKLVGSFLKEKGIEFESEKVESFATPRRIAVRFGEVALSTPRQKILKLGPAVSAAFDGEGNPTKAALGFARSVGAKVEDLGRFEGDKGERLGIEQEVGGERTLELLQEEDLLARWIDLGFPKTMRWIPGSELAYARPIRWVVCLLGEEVVPMRLGALAAGRKSRGHRTLSPGAVELPDATSYEATLEAASVVVRPARRREMIDAKARELAAEIEGSVCEDRGLLEELVYLAEHPHGLRGSYDSSLIEVLPREVIVTAMRAHQRYFSVESPRGELIPCFLTFRDGGDEGLQNVREGNERVLRARLEDAVFYWNEDRAVSSEEKLKRLDSVVWIEGFGSVGDKCRRVAALSRELGRTLLPKLDQKAIERAGLLCKSDLATEMIKDGKEFTKLQGTMGRYYALAAGEDEAVADAIAEHLQPRFAEDRLPEGKLGTLVALADRLDTIAGCVLAGFVPTGSQDPYALRRQALAILRILNQNELRCDLTRWIHASLAPFQRPADSTEEAATVITALFWGRLETLLSELPAEIVQSVLSVFPLDPVENARACEDLARLQGSETFQMLIEGARRCRNILVKAQRLPEESLPAQARAQALQKESRARWDADDLKSYDPEEPTDEAERELVRAAQRSLVRLSKALQESAYTSAYEALAELGQPIDRYFEEVLVNTSDPAVRRRRLDWLESLHYLFARFADLSRLPSLRTGG